MKPDNFLNRRLTGVSGGCLASTLARPLNPHAPGLFFLKALPEKHVSGHTLIEMLIALLIGVLLIFAVSETYVWSSRNFKQDSNTARMQENARFALDAIEQDLQMSGFMHEVLDTSLFDSSPVSGLLGTDCGPSGVSWAFDTGQLIETVAQDSTSNAVARFNCLNASELHTLGTSGAEFTEVLAIKRVKETTGPLVDGRIYLQTVIDGRSRLIAHNLPTNPADPAFLTASNWEYLTNIYYIGTQAGDSYPVLFRKTLQGQVLASLNDLSIETEAGGLAEGIEYFHITWGIDAEMVDGNAATLPDGNPNYFTSTPSTAELPGIVAAKAFVLVRSKRFDSSYIDNKQYTLGDLVLPTVGTFNDNYQRKVFSTSVKLRNRVIKNNVLNIIK